MRRKKDPRVQSVLEMREWQTFECKRALVRPSDALVPFVAIANADGGWFVLGLEDPDKAEGVARLCGVSEGPDKVSELLNLIPKQITPPILGLERHEIPVVNRAGETDCLLVFSIPKSKQVHSTRDGNTYLRRGRHNRKLTAAEIVQLKYAKGESHAEDDPVPRAGLDELDTGVLEEFRNAVGSQEKDVMTFLRHNGLAVSHEGKTVLNRAAVLLFGFNPAVTLRAKCSIKVSIFRGTTARFTDRPNLDRKPISIEGPLYRQIWDGLDYLKRLREQSPPILEGGSFHPKYLYPDYALQEAITNAVIHRDYSVQNDIQVRIFDNRIEFENPGRFAGHITLANILRERFARNPIILRTLNRFRKAPNLDIGEGVKRMFEAMQQANLIDPVYDVPPDHYFVKVTFYNEGRDIWEQVSHWLERHGRITNRAFRQLTGEQDSVRASRALQILVERGMLEPRGNGKRDRYYVSPTLERQHPLF